MYTYSDFIYSVFLSLDINTLIVITVSVFILGIHNYTTTMCAGQQLYILLFICVVFMLLYSTVCVGFCSG